MINNKMHRAVVLCTLLLIAISTLAQGVETPSTSSSEEPRNTIASAPSSRPNSIMLPSVSDITEIKVTVIDGGGISLSEIEAMLQRGDVRSYDAKTSDGWSYSPLCSGSFKTKSGEWAFTIFRGHRAIFRDGGGQRYLVDYKID